MMGMYTELVLKCSIRDDVPADVRAVLNHLFNGADMPKALPGHAFFECPRWDFIGKGSSFYHTPFALSKYSDGFEDDGRRGGHIFSRSDLKDYNDEIKHFTDWLMPYIDEPDGMCIGWSWYEEEDVPTLLIKGRKS
jgi:hypothetical protein